MEASNSRSIFLLLWKTFHFSRYEGSLSLQGYVEREGGGEDTDSVDFCLANFWNVKEFHGFPLKRSSFGSSYPESPWIPYAKSNAVYLPFEGPWSVPERPAFHPWSFSRSLQTVFCNLNVVCYNLRTFKKHFLLLQNFLENTFKVFWANWLIYLSISIY